VTAPAGSGDRRRNWQNGNGQVGYEDVRLRGCDHPLESITEGVVQRIRSSLR
jgi:hypothetical protein